MASVGDRLRPWWSLRIPDDVATAASLRRSRVMLWWAAGFVIAFLVVYVAFVWTRNGQRWDDAAWFGHKVQDGDLLLAAKQTLRALSVPVIVGASAVLCLIAWVRWGLRAGVVVGLFLVVTLGVAEVLKHWVLPRPEFYDFDPLAKAHNTLPSGHTTIGAMVAVGFILVLPRQVRGLVTIGAFAYAATVGGSTLAAGWHRPSDAIAAYLYVGFSTTLVIALMLRRGSARLLEREELGRLRGWSPFVWVVPLLGLLFLAASWGATVQEWPLITGPEPLTSWTVAQRDLAFTAGLTADYAAAGVVFTLLYLVLRRVELGVPRADWRRWNRRRDSEAAFMELPDAVQGVDDSPVQGETVEPPAPSPGSSLGDVTLLPETTRDESARGWGDSSSGGSGGSDGSGRDDWYLRERPPHHGD